MFFSWKIVELDPKSKAPLCCSCCLLVQTAIRAQSRWNVKLHQLRSCHQVNPKSQVSSICATICVQPIRHTTICTILYSIQSAAPSKFLLRCRMCHEASICIHLTIKLNPCPNYVQDSKISKPWASTHLSAAPRWFDSQHLREPGTTPASSTALETDAASKTWRIKI